VTPPRRRSWLLAGAAALVVVLVGGRWVASEVAERAWASSVADGQVYVYTRAVARFVRGVILFAAVAWGTGNVFLVYRAIGSVQLPRRLGDLEIVEAVPQRVLLAGTITSGLVFGVVLALGTGDWWMSAWLAARPPHFGVADLLLHRDLGYYVGRLPWLERVQALLLLAAVTGTVLVALLYVGMGSLHFRRWRPQASGYARAHLGALLAVTALAFAWGAVLDPAETVAGLHGPLGWGALSVRIPSAPLVTALAIAAGVASLVWALRDRATLLVATWAALLGVAVGAYVVAPVVWRGGTGPDTDAPLAAARTRLAELAFGAEARVAGAPPPWPTAEAAVMALPVWDAGRVAAAAQRRGAALLGPGRAVAGIALAPQSAPSGRASWVIAPMPDLDALARASGAPTWADVHRGSWAHAGRGVSAVEVDSGLGFARLGTRDSTAWYGPGFRSFAVAAPDTWPALRAAGIPLVAWWQRTALAWALQSPELVRAETDGLALLWRRDVVERLHRLAPFATFDAPAPLIADSTLWWVAYGYLESAAFPLVERQAWQGRPVGYLRPGLLGAVSAASGETRLYLAPGADSLAVAWARILDPLVRPLDSLPAALRAHLVYPLAAFRLAAALIAPPRPESAPGAPQRTDSAAWVARPREPFELVAPAAEGAADPRVWTAQGFETSTPRDFAALVAAAIGPRGPELLVWRPGPAPRLPSGLVGSPQPPTAPGTFRLWNVGGRLFSEQALFAEAGDGGGGGGGGARGGGESRTPIDTVFVTWGERHGEGATPAAALRDLLAPGRGDRLAGDTSLVARWDAVRRLAAQADAALSAGDLEAFGRYYRQLRQLLEAGRRTLVPTPGPR
jgi:hypothetical protein